MTNDGHICNWTAISLLLVKPVARWYITPYACSIEVVWNQLPYFGIRPIPGKVNLFWFQGKNQLLFLLDCISRFLNHRFVTWYMKSKSKTKIVEFFLSVREWAHGLNRKCHKRDKNVISKCHKRDRTKCRTIASKEIQTIEFHTNCMKFFVNMLSINIICVLLDTKSHNTSEKVLPYLG